MLRRTSAKSTEMTGGNGGSTDRADVRFRGRLSGDVIREHDGAAVECDAVVALLYEALIVPILTAHPTEVRRKSMIDRDVLQRLLRFRDQGQACPTDHHVVADAPAASGQARRPR